MKMLAKKLLAHSPVEIADALKVGALIRLEE